MHHCGQYRGMRWHCRAYTCPKRPPRWQLVSLHLDIYRDRNIHHHLLELLGPIHRRRRRQWNVHTCRRFRRDRLRFNLLCELAVLRIL